MQARRAGLLPQLRQLIIFEGASAKLSVMLFHRHRGIIWYAFGVACVNSRGVGLF